MTTYRFTDVSDLVYELQQFIDDQIEEAKEEPNGRDTQQR